MLLQVPERHRVSRSTESAPSQNVPRTILVGVDGSDEARAAFTAALERAGSDDTVIVVYAYVPVSGGIGFPYYQRALDARLRKAECVMRELRSSVTATLADVLFEHHEGRPAEVLARIATLRDVDEIVVGARRLGRLRALLGSVSRALLRTANRPVLVVPRGATAA